MKTIPRKWSLNLNYAYLVLLLVISSSSYAQDDVQCGADAYFQTLRLRENIPGEGSNGDFILYKVDPVEVTFTFIANLSVSDGPDDYAIPDNSSVNSLGVNPIDNQFYFISPSSPYQFYRMTGSGNVTYLGNLTGDISGSNVAGVFDREGNYYVTGGSRKLYQVDLNTLETSLIMNTGVTVSDIAINPDTDEIYGWDQGKRQLVTFDPSTQSTNVIGPEANTSDFGVFGALYFLPSGQLIGYGDNTTIPGGQEALVDFNLTTGVVTQLGTGPSVGVNDGASCPFTIAIDKDGPETAGLNSTITYTFKIFNRTAEVLHNIFFQDVLQDGLVFNSEPYNITNGLSIFGTSNGQTQTDLVLNNVPIGVSTFQIDVFIDCDFDDMFIENQAIIGIDNLDNPISSNDTDTAVIGDPTGTGIQPLELVFPEVVNVEGCLVSAVTNETSVFAFNTTESGDVAEEFNNAEGYEILPSIDNVVELTYVDVISADSSICGITIERTFSAEDNCGRLVEALQIINVVDTLAPVAESIPEELTLNCDEYDPEIAITPFTAQDNCSGLVEGVYTDVITEGDCASAYTITRTWSFTDDCENTSTSVQTINIVDVTAPVFDLPLPEDVTVECGALPDLTLLTATDNCGEVTVEVAEANVEDSCAIIRTWIATDSCGNSSEYSQTITIIDNEAPVFVLSNEEDACHTQLINGAFEAVQFNGIISFDQIQQENIPGWSTTASHGTIEIQRSGQVNGSPSHTGNFHFELNGQGLDDLYQSFCTIPESELTIQFFHRKRRVNEIVDSLELFAGSDLNNLTSLGVYSVTNADGWKENIVTYNVPSGQDTTMILFQALTGSTPSVGNLLDDISVSSDRNNFAELPQDTTVNCDEIPEPEQLTAEDNCGDVTVIFNEEIIYAGDDSEDLISEECFASEVIDYSPGSTSNGGSIPSDRIDPTKALGQPDGANEPGGFVSLGIGGSLTLKLGNPIFNGEGNDIAIVETSFGTDSCSGNNNESAQVEVSQDGINWFSAGEVCRDGAVDISITNLDFVEYVRLTDVTPGSGDGFDVDGIEPINGCGSDEPTEPVECSEYSIVRTWTAQDFCGNTTSHTQTITVVDTEAPVFNENLPNDITVECDDIPNAVNLTAFDSCSDATVEFEEVITDGDCSYEIIRTWIATDNCGNSRNHVQTITVTDETAPVLLGELEANISAECGEIPDVPELQFEDNCSSIIDVVFTEDDSQSNTFNDFEIFRTWTVTDSCGNASEFVQTVSVQIVNTIEAFDSRICNTDGPVDLFTFLQGEFDTNGEWTVIDGDSSLLNGSIFDPSSLEEDIVYTFNYALTNVSCPVERNLNITVDNCAVLSCGAEDVEISKAVTANGDAYNEFFTVGGIEECGFVIEVEIYNRWGSRVFKSNDYQNDWNGEFSSSGIGNADTVPTGTYYYVVNLRNSGLEPFAGPVYVATNK